MGVGMPAALKLHEFGALVEAAFDHTAYHVGSSVREKTGGWRDVDVRVLIPDDEYEAQGYGKPGQDDFTNGKWCAMALAFSALGREMTGLPIDFQIQQQSYANETFPTKGNPRSALCLSYFWEHSSSAEAETAATAPDVEVRDRIAGRLADLAAARAALKVADIQSLGEIGELENILVGMGEAPLSRRVNSGEWKEFIQERLRTLRRARAQRGQEGAK